MMSMVIVTKKCFIVAEALLNVSIQEENDFIVKNKKTVPHTYYSIRLKYQPFPNTNMGMRDQFEILDVPVPNKATADKLFSEIVNQWREQNPDQLFLNKIIESVLE